MFTSYCFIRKNTKELQNKLKDLGLIDGCAMTVNGDNCLDIDNYLFCCLGEYSATNGTMETWNRIFPNQKYIDCGTNEDMFLAIAALRDDSDKYQWFVSSEGHYRQSMDEAFDEGMANYIHYFPTRWHKATVSELVEHFGKDNK